MTVHQIRIAGHDIRFTCAADETVLDAAERAGYALPYSCRTGVCETCEGDILEGKASAGASMISGPSPALLCRARPLSDLSIHPKRIERREPVLRKTIVASVYQLARVADVAILRLRFPAGTRAKFRAGQYARVFLPDGDSRHFSLASPPQESDGVQFHIRHVPGGRFSENVLASLKAGDKLTVELPFGEFFLREESERPLIFLATGTGFAPIKSMIEDMLKRNIGRHARLYWGAKRESDLYMRDLIVKWQARASWLEFVPVLSEPDAEWQGQRGLVHEAVLAELPDLSGYDVYACGNPLMIEAATESFPLAGSPREHFYADPFVPTGGLETELEQSLYEQPERDSHVDR